MIKKKICLLNSRQVPKSSASRAMRDIHPTATVSLWKRDRWLVVDDDGGLGMVWFPGVVWFAGIVWFAGMVWFPGIVWSPGIVLLLGMVWFEGLVLLAVGIVKKGY